MSLRIDRLELVGGGRSIDFSPTRSVVVGPIASGKSTLVRLLRALVGKVPPDLPPEVTENVTALRADITLSGETWRVKRPLTQSDTSIVEVAGEDSLALPAHRRTRASSQTYGTWLLEQLGLPALQVPQARTRADSDASALSIADFLNYSFLRGDEIDNCVLGHTHPFRNIKRKYVFEVVYGLYDDSVADLEAELRKTNGRLDYLRNEETTATRIFEGTELANGEALRVELERQRSVREQLRGEAVGLSEDAEVSLGSTELRSRVERASDDLVRAQRQAEAAEAQVTDLEALIEQLQAQQSRLVRAILAEEALVDFEFVVCPRCGQDLAESHPDGDACLLCHQTTPDVGGFEQLEKERARIGDQIVETEEVLETRRLEVAEALSEAANRRSEREALGRELNLATATFISDRQAEIEETAARLASVDAEISKYETFVSILDQAEERDAEITRLESRASELRSQIERASERLRSGQDHLDALDERFLEYIQRLDVPSFGEVQTARIDRSEYLPVVAGRPFAQLSSQGLQVLVNVAHILAHHTVSIDRGLGLPGLVVIDGPSSNVGTEGFDEQRFEDVFGLIGEISDEYGDRLQIVVVDNRIPELAEEWVDLRLTEDDRLIEGQAVAADLDGAGSTEV